MSELLPNTEERILEAAKKVFHRKGYDGARMQEIANEAGVNKALLHYYYRSKDNIFQAVFEDAFSRLLSRINSIFFSEQPLDQKIPAFVDYYLTFLSENSYLPGFILNSLHERPDLIRGVMEKNRISPEKLLARIGLQLNEEYGIRINPLHIFVNVLSLSVFPIVVRPLIQSVAAYPDEKMNQFYEERKKMLPDFILNALKGYAKASEK